MPHPCRQATLCARVCECRADVPATACICSRPQVCDDKQTGAGAPFMPTCFTGPGVTLPMVLTYAGRGGQIILTEMAWDAVKPIVTKHPGAVSFLSLGQHVVSDDFSQPMMLMEVMPNLLSGRAFAAPTTRRMLQPGFRDAPKPDAPMAIVFVKVCGWGNRCGCIQCPVRFGRKGGQPVAAGLLWCVTVGSHHHMSRPTIVPAAS